jgi:hypothetical protein
MSSLDRLGFTIGPSLVVAALLTLIPYFATAFFSTKLTASVQRLPLALRLLCPAAVCVPYVLLVS